MSQKPNQIAHIVAILPFFATGALPSPFLELSATVSGGGGYFFAGEKAAEVRERELTEEKAEKEEQQKQEEREIRGAKIDAYFTSRSMPLAGMGGEMVRAAEENGLDWRLLPAIAVRESSGGKQMCGSNPFGWASCKVRFGSVEEAVRTVALHLGGNHPKTGDYYDGDTREKLYHYNGTVIPTYPDEVIAIMDKIGKQDIVQI